MVYLLGCIPPVPPSVPPPQRGRGGCTDGTVGRVPPPFSGIRRPSPLAAEGYCRAHLAVLLGDGLLGDLPELLQVPLLPRQVGETGGGHPDWSLGGVRLGQTRRCWWVGLAGVRGECARGQKGAHTEVPLKITPMLCCGYDLLGCLWWRLGYLEGRVYAFRTNHWF